jgi:hypothetical protein
MLDKRVYRSNLAHERLIEKAGKKIDSLPDGKLRQKAHLSHEYHHQVRRDQTEYNQIMSPGRKKEIYQNVKARFKSK